MFNNRRKQALLAASLYDDVSDAETKELDSALERSHALRKEAAAMRQLVNSIPIDPIECPVDVLPDVRRRLRPVRTTPVYAPRFRWAMATFAAASLIAAAAFLYTVQIALSPIQPGVETAQHVVVPHRDAVAVALDAAYQAVLHGDFTGAYRTVESAITAAPEAPDSAEGRLFLADLAFEELHWYSEAQAGYQAFRQVHDAAFTKSPEAVRKRVLFRLELLAETSPANFEPLHSVRAAARRGDQPIRHLESLLARSGGVYLPALLAHEMALAVDPDALTHPARLVAAMESVRRQCTQPAALAHLDYEIGAACFEDLSDPAKAFQHMTLAAEIASGALKERAEAYLARLNTQTRP